MRRRPTKGQAGRSRGSRQCALLPIAGSSFPWPIGIWPGRARKPARRESEIARILQWRLVTRDFACPSWCGCPAGERHGRVAERDEALAVNRGVSQSGQRCPDPRLPPIQHVVRVVALAVKALPHGGGAPGRRAPVAAAARRTGRSIAMPRGRRSGPCPVCSSRGVQSKVGSTFPPTGRAGADRPSRAVAAGSYTQAQPATWSIGSSTSPVSRRSRYLDSPAPPVPAACLCVRARSPRQASRLELGACQLVVDQRWSPETTVDDAQFDREAGGRSGLAQTPAAADCRSSRVRRKRGQRSAEASLESPASDGAHLLWLCGRRSRCAPSATKPMARSVVRSDRPSSRTASFRGVGRRGADH